MAAGALPAPALQPRRYELPVSARPPLFTAASHANNMPLAKDLLHPTAEEERRRHKKKRLVQSPNSYFMDVKCPGCYKITTVFSHAQTVVLCVGCSTVLCQPTGGKARLTEGCSFRRKQH
ncbi:40S ribosomal protein S27.2 [Tachysurus ichikawai]